jgi:hypothetical protein
MQKNLVYKSILPHERGIGKEREREKKREGGE